MDQSLSFYLEQHQALINDYLEDYITNKPILSSLKTSMLYSIRAGGKRLRPILMMAACEAFGGKKKDVLPVAAALEMIHTYSLIHDDLPAMDDDDLRRGQPTNHKKFDEATAILAGDALLTLSFQTIMEAEGLSDIQKVHLVKKLSIASGALGMVAGQLMDMESEGKEIPLENLEQIHHLKTGRLISYALMSGAYIGGANESQLQSLVETADLLGIIFQIQDDILDVSGNAAKLGKPVGSDTINNKSTYPGILGIEGSLKTKNLYVNRAKTSLREAEVGNTMLFTLIDHLSDRDH
ncbi:farnesyl diphosphate synthase [Thalassobacillus devorans]|uniref:Farnesyl diphosphate synthase n=1 Tax=Thalassobacillus devorans TaxID=279813 RepID=A0ABQ1P601_9BACI|nr:farnesyl diphosphate synthase [Thalassobacillus devorans]NIK29592.1 geranylgeranyl diphosphate synthase type II [Thalassobacillus devorans]GGC91281.1 farnesyl diphosphate synthase [Thalassobacillus devorans]